MRKYVIIIIFTVILSCFALTVQNVSAASTIVSGKIEVQTIPNSTLAEKITQRASSSLPWYITRASGLIAAGALIILMLSGIGLITGGMFRFLEPLTAWASHRALGITFGIAILIHMFSLLFDHFVPYRIIDLFIPWASGYKPVTIAGLQLGSFFTALGVLAFYGIVLVVITSLTWIEKRPYIWRLVHLLSYLVMLFVFFHSLYMGTDLAGGVLRFIWVAIGVIVAVMILIRLWRAKTI